MQPCGLRHNKVEAKTGISYLRDSPFGKWSAATFRRRRLHWQTPQENATVHADSSDLLENVPYAHSDLDAKMLDKLSISSHAQTSFFIVRQPIGDQQSKGSLRRVRWMRSSRWN